nr:TNT domain-containing protein [Haloechinothrix aidingensis]
MVTRQDVEVAHATQLNATEQDTLVKQIGLALLRAAPQDWQSITAEYRAVGKYHELDGEVTFTDGTTREWIATHDIASMFGKLRAGMYRDQRGTWFNAVYQLDAPASYNLEYDRDEPQWNMEPPPQAYSDELRMFPRSDDNVPEWLMRRLAGLGPERPGPRFRFARVFDGTGPSGRPLINRAELDSDEREKVLEYLNTAPVVLPGNGVDTDRLSGQSEPTVPVAFHSDGTWIWPAAVNYYLREHGVAPEPDLVAHIRANGFTVPEVTQEQRAAASSYVAGGSNQQAQQAPPPPPPRHQAAPPPQAEPHPQPGGGEPADRHAAGPPSGSEAQAAALADFPVIERLASKLDELGVDRARFRIGEPARHAWSLEQVDNGWRVGWYDESLTNPAVFGDAEDAAAFMLGKLLLAEQPAAQATGAERAQHEAGPAAGAAAGAAPSQQLPETASQPSKAGGTPAQPGPGQQWPIQPLPGEPPLTLFRGKEIRQLPAGSELDRFGSPDGNLTYIAGTPFEERSLVPEWVHRTYHVYRVQRPIEALTGVAIPWFNQPGGGHAYLLPVSVQELLDSGVLIELEPGDPPVD